MKRSWKWLEKVIQPAFGCPQHPKAGRNTQHPLLWYSLDNSIDNGQTPGRKLWKKLWPKRAEQCAKRSCQISLNLQGLENLRARSNIDSKSTNNTDLNSD